MAIVYPAKNDGSFQLSMYQENILRPLKGFVIKSNLNKNNCITFYKLEISQSGFTGT